VVERDGVVPHPQRVVVLEDAAPVVLADFVLLHQIVHAANPPVGDLPAALVGGPVVERDGALDAERLRLVGEEVRQLGVAQQRLRRDAADVEAHPAPIALLDDRRAQAQLRRAHRGGVAARPRAQHHDVEVLAHTNNTRASRGA
jgi:hypothetical protein